MTTTMTNEGTGRLKDQVVERLKAARASFEDDLKSDHEALGHILSVLEDSAGIERPEPGDEPAAELVATDPTAPQAG